MALIRRKWTAREADEWTKEDTLTIIISPIVYVLITIGTVLSVLLIQVGFILLISGIIDVNYDLYHKSQTLNHIRRI